MSKTFYYYFEKVQCFFIVFIITPCFFLFMMTVVRSNLVEIWQLNRWHHLFHLILSCFLFFNVVGNMMCSILTDTSLKKAHLRWKTYDYCNKCEMFRPRKSWHCDKCNVCILKRDHHCYMFSSCIGLYNQRYYIAYLFYVTIAMLYSTLYSYYFVNAKFDRNCLLVSTIRLLNPFLRYYLHDQWTLKELYVGFVIMNIVLLLWSLGLLSFHLKNVMKGATAHESKSVTLKLFHSKWKQNMINVFGVRWYWALVCPLAKSPLPDSELIGSDENETLKLVD